MPRDLEDPKIELLGLRDKLYWRPTVAGPWHCFKKLVTGGYVSLCGREVRTRSGGQQVARPPVVRRCGPCDVAEIERRRAQASLPSSPSWRDHAIRFP